MSQDIEGFRTSQGRYSFGSSDRKFACNDKAHFTQTYSNAFSSKCVCLCLSRERFCTRAARHSSLRGSTQAPCGHVLAALPVNSYSAKKNMFEPREQHPNHLTHQPINCKVPNKAESGSKYSCCVDQT